MRNKTIKKTTFEHQMRIHFIAIGGSAMHNLAIALQNNGHEVTGSDDELFEPSKSRLSQKGLLPEKEGWFPEKITTELDAIILGMHAKPANPELLKAQEIGVKIYSYPEFLFEQSKDKVRVVIGGSHGKTTITAMVMHVLKDCGHPFDYLVGSKLKGFDVMVNISEEAMLMVFEGDEYLSSPIDRRPKFHWYKPNIALLSGIAWDHINVFPTKKEYNKQFSIFIDLMQKGGTIVYNEEDTALKVLVERARNDVVKIPYGVPEFKIVDGETELITGNGTVQLKIFGKHNLMNLNGARLICKSLGIDETQFYSSITTFEGASNRLELLKVSGENRVYKDFAHAPSKVKATIEAVKEQFPLHQLVACLELHTFSSLNQRFIDQYFGSFDMVDRGCIYYNPHALAMKRLPDLDEEDVRKAFGNENLAIFADSTKLKEWLMEDQQNKTVYLLMSSGNFDGIDLNELAGQLI
jgi:UDP-N-acetylmuramate: L-alanyl-gamma-D-glutamyl-meso-diaminopimelate ligase